MLKNNREISLIPLVIILIIIFVIGIFLFSNKDNDDGSSFYENEINLNHKNEITDPIINQEKKSIYDLFNKRIIYNFGAGTAYEIDIPQIINDYDQIAIRNNYLLLFSSEDVISIGKNETIFEDLPPNEGLIAGSSKSYTLIYEEETTKLYEVTYSFVYVSPDGTKSKKDMSYALYRKDNGCTLEITGSDKDNILKLSNLITNTNQSKTLEEQFYGITVLDERIIDTSKITINEIYNVDAFLDLGIKVDGSLIDVRFLSKEDKAYLPALKNKENWKLVTEEDNYKIYHGYSSGVQSDALKIIKDDKEYFIDLSIPGKFYIEEDTHVSEDFIRKIIQEIINILK